MASKTDDDVRTTRSLRRAFCWTLAVGTAFSGALVLSAPRQSPAPTSTDLTSAGMEFTLPDIPGVDYSGLTGIPGIKLPHPVRPQVAPMTTTGEVAIEAARSKLGADYRANSAGPDAFDCSGLVQWSYEQAGVSLPRTSYEQLGTGTPVSQGELRPGDLVSFYGGGHSGLYAGDGNVIHASTYGEGVTTSPMSSMPFAGARRFQD
ncbi:cell wall-associated NlpC family hydrolase [Nocardia tenerifensis]|uniref:Cell wall-associated NlpC family hydrolase n=1 Tax=Nocardia tenerifensis TaxID=228006 RepID=A0A318KBS1_9NOCA|nr:C40 family peptidase [Nocardia tenerifensis]PXX68670.1 cell wall-associated NlpC family hydrolase [Nocardia tenerifensis]